MSRKIVYSPETRENALAALDRNDGNIYRTAKEMEVSRDTILRWARETERREPYGFVRKDHAMDEVLEQIAQKIVMMMPDKVRGASLQELARVLPVVLSTLKEVKSSKAYDGSNVRQELADLVADLAARSEAIENSGSNDGGTDMEGAVHMGELGA